MAERRKVFLAGAKPDQLGINGNQLLDECDLVSVQDLRQAISELNATDETGVCLLLGRNSHADVLLEAGGLLQRMPDGVALLDVDSRVLWCNERLKQFLPEATDCIGTEFLDAFGTAEIMGPDFCPVHTALGSGETARSTLRTGEKQYTQIDVTPVAEEGEFPTYLVAVARDVSEDVLQRQKLNAIYQAGLELGDLQPQDVLDMSLEERVELLRQKILHYTQDVLEFETVEIRLLEQSTKRLKPLLAVGMQPDAEGRELSAEAEHNGVTGFVAATGRSYLCEDTLKDPLYLPGAPGARSSLTVPLILHEQVLGTFNVESPRPCAFSQNDLQFLELFSREVALALNTLELLLAEQATMVAASTERTRCEVAGPADEILNDAAWILEKYIGHDAPVAERLQRILQHTREIRETIEKVGESLNPAMSRTGFDQRINHPKLRSKRILVADSDGSVRRAAHELLGRYGCVVETAHDGEESLLMARTFHYDAVLVDIALPDMNGAECFERLRETHEHLPVILMTGFGYDPTHSIVKARQLGLQSVLYKPFRLDQLITAVEKAVTGEPALAAREG